MNTRKTAAALLLLTMACGQSARQEKAPATVEIADAIAPVADDSMADFNGTDEDAEEPTAGYALLDQANTVVAADVSGGTMSIWSSGAKPVPNVGAAFSSRAAVQGTDTVHRFIRTADLRFRVKDVVAATLAVEDIVGAHKGWVTKTTLRSEPRGQEVIAVSADSSLEISRFRLLNQITLRVPNAELDSTLRQIGRLVDAFDHRTILADDIRLRMMANAMAVRRAKAHSLRVAQAIDDQGRKLRETLAAEEALEASDEKRDQGILNNLELADRVAYSTVTLNLYQRDLTRKEMIANERNIDAYRPSLWSRVVRGLKDGWELVELTVAGLATIWPVLVLLGGAFWLLRRGASRRRSSTPPQQPIGEK
jgi:hypothetical protein